MGNTYYVDPAAGGDNDGSEWAHAWVDLQSAIDAWAAGDTVYCRGTQTISGSAKANGLVDTSMAPGSVAAGAVNVIGCDAGGTARAGQFTLQGNGADKPAFLLRVSAGNMDHIHWENIDFNGTNVTGDLVQADTAGNNDYVHWRQCRFMNGTANGVDSDRSLTGGRFIQCVFANNGGDGIQAGGAPVVFLFCRFVGNTGYGLFAESNYGSTVYGCLFHDNTLDDMRSDQGGDHVLGCVFDGTDGGDDGFTTRTGKLSLLAIANRFTNHSVAGKYGMVGSDANDQSHIEDWNLFCGNTADLSLVISGRHSYGDGANHISDPAGDGYRSAANNDFKLTSSAVGALVDVNLDWDTAPAATDSEFAMTAGLPLPAPTIPAAEDVENALTYGYYDELTGTLAGGGGGGNPVIGSGVIVPVAGAL